MQIKIYDNGDLIQMYLDWFNNFLTVPRFAEYYNISETFADEIIRQGRQIYEQQINGGKYVKVAKNV